MTTATWQVLDGSGGVREVPVRMEGGQLLVGAGPGPRVWDATVPPRLAVASLAVSMGWPVREILSPKDASQASRLSLLGGLLAVIHRDGGHYLAQHGVEHACGEAVRCVLSDREALAAMTAERDDARRAATLAEAERDALRAELARRDEVERAARADADAVMAHFMAPGEGDTALAEALDPVDALNAAVTAAILRAERLAREGADATAAYADVARYEAALSALHPADTVEGETAREGVALATGAAAVVRAAEGARR